MKGGLSAVVFTDAIQTVVLILAAVIMTGIGLHEVGGYEALRAKLDPAMFSMVKPATDPDLPWPGVFIGVFFVGHLLLLDGPGARAAGVRRQEPQRRAARRDVLRLPEDAQPDHPRRARA